MDSDSEIAHDYSPFLKIYKDGRVERILGTTIVPPSLDPTTGVQSKDAVVSSESDVSVRLYIPKTTTTNGQKLPILVYYHGGGFCIETAASPTYHNYLNSLVFAAQVLVVSVNYRRAPEHPLPVAYEDSWEAVKWVASHSDGSGPEEWLNLYGDFKKVFFAGDSAGANIAHHMGLRMGQGHLDGIGLEGIIMVHPYFWGNDPVGSESVEPEKRAIPSGLWHLACPKTSGCDDPFINPGKDPKLGSMGCGKILVCVAEKDVLRHRGYYYEEVLKNSGWKGEIEVVEIHGEDHVFHLANPICENAQALMKKIASFMN